MTSSEAEWAEINRKKKEGSGEESEGETISKVVKQWDAQTQSYIELG